jgi:hypothetical protein
MIVEVSEFERSAELIPVRDWAAFGLKYKFVNG